MNTSNTPHPLTLTKSSHHSMLDRCYNPRSPNFKHYGARGILTLPEWRGPGGFKAFVAFLTSPGGPGLRPSLQHSIERLDVNKGYFPGNIGWVLKHEQPKNRRNCWLVGGQCAAEAARDVDMHRACLVNRLKAGRTEAEALGMPNKNDHLDAWLKGHATPGATQAVLGLTRIRIWQLMKAGDLPAVNMTRIPGGKARWWTTPAAVLALAEKRGEKITNEEAISRISQVA